MKKWSKNPETLVPQRFEVDHFENKSGPKVVQVVQKWSKMAKNAQKLGSRNFHLAIFSSKIGPKNLEKWSKSGPWTKKVVQNEKVVQKVVQHFLFILLYF